MKTKITIQYSTIQQYNNKTESFARGIQRKTGAGRRKNQYKDRRIEINRDRNRK